MLTSPFTLTIVPQKLSFRLELSKHATILEPPLLGLIFQFITERVAVFLVFVLPFVI
jgi:hypothetical protein